jgi:hypothetical protein
MLHIYNVQCQHLKLSVHVQRTQMLLVYKRVTDYCLMQTQQFFSYRVHHGIYMYIYNVQCQHLKLSAHV